MIKKVTADDPKVDPERDSAESLPHLNCLALAPLTLETSRIFQNSRVATRTFMSLLLRLWRSVVNNWSYGAFWLLQKKTKSFSFGLQPPMHRSGSNGTRNCSPCMQQQVSAKFHQEVNVWQTGGRKTCF